MPTHDNEQANARRRVVYAQNIDKNNKKLSQETETLTVKVISRTIIIYQEIVNI